jgi:beta-lactamase superfamily II metal-dependent hydrolase
MKKPVFVILGVLFCSNIFAWSAVFSLNHPFLEVIFFDVGQGDSILTEWMQYIPSYLGLSSLSC